MLRRHPKSEFMGEAYVFPGGAVDPEDSSAEMDPFCKDLPSDVAAQRLGFDDPLKARGFYVAGVRETFEEAGLLLTREGMPAEGQTMRDSLNARESPLAPLLDRYKVTLALDQLKVWDHWVTPIVSKRRFDTWFFIARAPAGQDASFNTRESTDGRWLSAAGAREQHSAGQLMLAPPTLCILQDLSRHATVEDALAAAPDGPVAPKIPELFLGGEAPTLLLPGDGRHSGNPGGEEEDYVVMNTSDGMWRRVRGSG